VENLPPIQVRHAIAPRRFIGALRWRNEFQAKLQEDLHAQKKFASQLRMLLDIFEAQQRMARVLSVWQDGSKSIDAEFSVLLLYSVLQLTLGDGVGGKSSGQAKLGQRKQCCAPNRSIELLPRLPCRSSRRGLRQFQRSSFASGGA
jgi:hypothetical protein